VGLELIIIIIIQILCSFLFGFTEKMLEC